MIKAKTKAGISFLALCFLVLILSIGFKVEASNSFFQMTIWKESVEAEKILRSLL